MELDAVGSATANFADVFSMSSTIRRQSSEKGPITTRFAPAAEPENDLLWNRFRGGSADLALQGCSLCVSACTRAPSSTPLEQDWSPPAFPTSTGALCACAKPQIHRIRSAGRLSTFGLGSGDSQLWRCPASPSRCSKHSPGMEGDNRRLLGGVVCRWTSKCFWSVACDQPVGSLRAWRPTERWPVAQIR
jgi:hypothetical protein